MQRRELLAISIAGAVTSAGCIDSLDSRNTDEEGEWSPEVDGEEPELAPGDESTILIDAETVKGIKIKTQEDVGLPSDESDAEIVLDVNNADITPSPNKQQDSNPPIWLWDSFSSVEVRIPVQVSDGVKSGDYTYGVVVYEGEFASGKSAEFEFNVSVR